MAVLIALVGVSNTLGLSVIKHTRESALLRALGLQTRSLRLMLLIEALLAGVGVLVGIGAGVFFGWLGSTALIAMTDGAEPRLAVDLPLTLGMVVVAVVAAALASVLPGRRAAQASPVEALAENLGCGPPAFCVPANDLELDEGLPVSSAGFDRLSQRSVCPQTIPEPDEGSLTIRSWLGPSKPGGLPSRAPAKPAMISSEASGGPSRDAQHQPGHPHRSGGDSAQPAAGTVPRCRTMTMPRISPPSRAPTPKAIVASIMTNGV